MVQSINGIIQSLDNIARGVLMHLENHFFVIKVTGNDKLVCDVIQITA
jgi:hypothetical protein